MRMAPPESIGTFFAHPAPTTGIVQRTVPTTTGTASTVVVNRLGVATISTPLPQPTLPTMTVKPPPQVIPPNATYQHLPTVPVPVTPGSAPVLPPMQSTTGTTQPGTAAQTITAPQPISMLRMSPTSDGTTGTAVAVGGGFPWWIILVVLGAILLFREA